MNRLRYSESHWSRETNSEKALEQYLTLCKMPINKAMTHFFKYFAGDVKGKNILDYGGGAGFMSILFAEQGGQVLLVDAEYNALKTAHYFAKKNGVENRIKTICSKNVPKDIMKHSFDLVIVKDVIEHINDDQKFLKEISSCQKEGGRLLISTQNKLSLNYIIEGAYQKYRCKNLGWCGWDPTHVRFYTPQSLKKKLRKVGYKPKKLASVFIIPYNILSWAFLLRKEINISFLYYFDVKFGHLYPFNRLGWNFLLCAEKCADKHLN